jgi:hypothetical protein
MSANESRSIRELSARNAFNNRSCCGDAGAGIYDAACFYEDGAFRLFCLPCCLPEIFTVRFTAPADFTAGSAFVIDGTAYAATRLDMDAAEDGAFAAGAVVTAEVDTCRKIIFISSSVAAAGNPGECGCEGCGDLLSDTGVVYYVDLNGDNSPLTPGTAEAPFKSLMGAVKAICRRRPPSVYAGITISINEGVYPEEDCVIHRWCETPLTITGTAASPTLNCSNGLTVQNMPSVTVANVKIASPGMCFNSRRSVTTMNNIEVITTGANTMMVNLAHHSWVFLDSLIVNNAGGQTQNSIVCVNTNTHVGLLPQSVIRFVNTIATTSGTFVVARHSNAEFDNPSFVNATNVSGRRYYLARMGTIETGGKGANYLPGSAAGIIVSGAGYYL